MNANCEKELLNCENVEQMFSVLAKYYDLKSIKPGTAVKSMMVRGFSHAFAVLKPIEKK